MEPGDGSGRRCLAETESADARLRLLEERLAAVEDREAIERLQNQYGYYLDNRMWDEVVELFRRFPVHGDRPPRQLRGQGARASFPERGAR